jgi:hypothetical protein
MTDCLRDITGQMIVIYIQIIKGIQLADGQWDGTSQMVAG